MRRISVLDVERLDRETSAADSVGIVLVAHSKMQLSSFSEQCLILSLHSPS